MRFHVILSKTLNDLLSPKRTIALVILGILPTVIMSLVLRSDMAKTPMSLHMETHNVIDNFTPLLFMVVTGIFLTLIVSATAASFISKEDSDGTLLIMVSKPINRFEIILGKFLALIINAMLIEIVVLLLSAMIFWLVLPIDPETLAAVLGLIPWLLLYSLLVTIVFGSVAIAFSTLIKSRVKIMLVLMLLIMLIFFVGQIPRTAFSTTYENYRLYYGDLGYHLGNTFTMLMENTEAGQMMPTRQAIMTVFAGTYKDVEDNIDPDIGAYPPSLELTNYVSPAISTTIWLCIFAIALALAIWAMERKEVH